MFKTTLGFTLLLLMTFSAQAQPPVDSIKLTKNFLLLLPQTFNAALPAAVPSNASVQHLPFFCDKEYKLEKWTKIPFRFRLGSVAYCDKMEGKDQ